MSAHTDSPASTGPANTGPVQRPSWLSKDVYPFDLRTVDLPTGPVTYIDEGRGPSLLFVHAGMWSFIFRDVITRLSDDYRCVTVDFPGYGLSPDPDSGGEPDPKRRLTWLASILESFVETLDLTDITAVAHDLGGSVTMAAAVRHPDRYRAFVLANTFIWPADTTALRTMLRVVGSGAMTAIGSATNLVPKLTSGGGGIGRHLEPGAQAAFLGPYQRRAPRRRFHETMRAAIADTGLVEELGLVGERLADRPVLTIFGEKNDPFGFQQRLATIFPDHNGVVVEKGNHFPMCDDPDLFAEQVRRWHTSAVADRR